MYCPVCFQSTMKIRSSGVIKLSFNGKARNTSLFTYNLQKETPEQLVEKLREKIIDFFTFYSEFKNKTPIKRFEAYSSDFECSKSCKIDVMNTKISVIGIIYPTRLVKRLLIEEAKKLGIEVELTPT
jgi:alpha-glucosidase (family GH31 glycosyl hydrolase)